MLGEKQRRFGSHSQGASSSEEMVRREAVTEGLEEDSVQGVMVPTRATRDLK